MWCKDNVQKGIRVNKIPRWGLWRLLTWMKLLNNQAGAGVHTVSRWVCYQYTVAHNRQHWHYSFIYHINCNQQGNVTQIAPIEVEIYLPFLFFFFLFYLPCLSTLVVVGTGSSQWITLSVWPSCQLSPETWGARLSAQPSAATTRTLCNFNLSGGRGGRNVTGWQFSLPATPSAPSSRSLLVKGPRIQCITETGCYSAPG